MNNNDQPRGETQIKGSEQAPESSGQTPETAAPWQAGTQPFFGTTPEGANERDRRPPGTPDWAGQTIGDYELLDKLGEGGMGVVYRARQRSADRIVALKVIRPECLASLSPDSRAETLQRFINEAQAAARLDHEHIVTVYDVGEADGQPFYSMRFVEGRSLGHILRDGPLENRRAAAFLEPVARAVHYAHQRGILHRDLKPVNVMVDAAAHPFVADFGLAKLTESSSDMTRTGQVMGTPAYMSPEQAQDASRCTPLSDVYSLGATLYDLLTGRPPFRAATVVETLKQVIDQEPVAPRQLNPAIDRDLETITLKCLSKEPGRRYGSAGELADDLRQYLHGEPIHARPVGRPERLVRWVKRKPAVASLAGSVALLLVALLAGSVFFALYQRAAAGQLFAKNTDLDRANLDLTQSNADLKKSNDAERAAKDEAKEQAAIALAVNEFFQNDVIRQADSRKQAERKTEVNPILTLREALDRAAERIGDRFQGQELTEAAIRQAIGDAYLGVSEADKGIPHLERSVALRQTNLGPEHPDTLASMNNLAVCYQDAGKLDQALPLLEETLKLTKAKLGPHHPDTFGSMNNLAQGYKSAGKLDQALPLMEETLMLSKATLGPDHPNTLKSMSNLAGGYFAVGKLDQALPLLEETLTRRKAKLGPHHPDTLQSINNLAGGYRAAGKLNLALPLIEETLTLRKAKLGPDHSDTLNSMTNLAALFWSMNQLDRSIPLFEEVLAVQKRKLGDEHPTTLLTVANLGVNYRDAGRLDEAIPLLEQAYRKGRKHAVRAEFANDLVSAYVQAGKTDEATTIINDQLASARERLKPDSPELGGVLAMSGKHLLDLKSYRDAEPLLRECLAVREKLAPDAWNTFNAQSLLGAALVGQGQHAGAEPLLLSGHAGLEKTEPSIPPQAKYNLRDALQRLVQLYTAWDKPAEAAKWRAELETIESEAKKPK